MKRDLFSIVASQTDEIVKEAFLGAALRIGQTVLKGVGSLGTKAIRNPGKTMGAAFTASDLASGAQRFSNVSAANASNPFTRSM